MPAHAEGPRCANPVFIVGPPRSGTTFLQLIVSAHPRFFSGPETHFFTYLMPQVTPALQGRLDTDQIRGILRLLPKKPGISLPHGRYRQIMQRARPKGLSSAELLDAIMQTFHPGPPADRWVEKTPRHALVMDRLFSAFPDARVVALIRDPRDVASSRSPFGTFSNARERTVYRAQRADLWVCTVGQIGQWRSDPRVLVIRYEDIVGDTTRSAETIAEFLGETFAPAMVDSFADGYNRVVVPAEQEHKAMAAHRKVVDRRGIWQDRMLARDVRIVEALCRDEMMAWGYEPRYRERMTHLRGRLEASAALALGGAITPLGRLVRLFRSYRDGPVDQA